MADPTIAEPSNPSKSAATIFGWILVVAWSVAAVVWNIAAVVLLLALTSYFDSTGGWPVLLGAAVGAAVGVLPAALRPLRRMACDKRGWLLVIGWSVVALAIVVAAFVTGSEGLVAAIFAGVLLAWTAGNTLIVLIVALGGSSGASAMAASGLVLAFAVAAAHQFFGVVPYEVLGGLVDRQ